MVHQAKQKCVKFVSFLLGSSRNAGRERVAWRAQTTAAKETSMSPFRVTFEGPINESDDLIDLIEHIRFWAPDIVHVL